MPVYCKRLIRSWKPSTIFVADMHSFSINALVSSGLLLSSGFGAAEVIPGREIAQIAQAALKIEAKEMTITQIGSIYDIPISPGRRWSLSINDVNNSSAVSRSSVTIRIDLDGAFWRTCTVWFSVTKPMRTSVYSQSHVKGAHGNTLSLESAVSDMRNHEFDVVKGPILLSGLRLRRSVIAGSPILASDFEAIPDVVVGQSIEVESIHGSARILTNGRAVSEGLIGQSILVIVKDGEKSVRARIRSSNFVTVEN